MGAFLAICIKLLEARTADNTLLNLGIHLKNVIPESLSDNM